MGGARDTATGKEQCQYCESGRKIAFRDGNRYRTRPPCKWQLKMETRRENTESPSRIAVFFLIAFPRLLG